MSKKKKHNREIDWTAEEHFDKKRSFIYIEHTLECPIFGKKAEEFLQFLREQVPDREFILIRNDNGKLLPRPGAFEIEFSQNARTSRHCLWSGMECGPPRRDKFPNFEKILPEVQKVLKKFYADLKPIEDEGD